jgi:hypothetical protein
MVTGANSPNAGGYARAMRRGRRRSKEAGLKPSSTNGELADPSAG